MAIFYEAPVTPDDLTMFTRNVPLIQNMVLNRILPDRTINDNRVDVGQLTRTGRTARFRVFDGPIHVARRDSYTVQNVALPPLSDSLAMGEYERLQIQFARTGGTNQGALVNAIYDDATILTQNVRRRMELARGDVLVDGKFTLAGEGGLYMEADFLVPGGNFVTAAPLWTDTANADIIANLDTWSQAYLDLNGFLPGGMILSRTVVNNMLRNQKLRTAYGTNLTGTQTLLRREQVESALDSYSLPPIEMVYDSSVDVDGVSTRVLPSNKVIFVPPAGQTLGYTAWGVSATALELVNSSESDLSFADAPGIVGVVEKQGPPYRQYTFVDAVGMPVLENPNFLMVATVG
jgi:hypothetical protein